MRFEFATATRIIFGPGKLREAGVLAKDLGRRALVVTGRNQGPAERLMALLRKEGIASDPFSVSGEPEVETVKQGAALAKEQRCDLVISLGGGSAIDTGKAIAAMLTNEGDLADYLEVIGSGKALTTASAPFIAIPTTAGTGSEVTRNAVLASPEHRVKVSLRSPHMMPKIAIVDPELAYDLPGGLTASTGLDAFTQLIEPYVCSRANPMTDALCIEGIRRAARSLPVAFKKPHDAAAREDMALASLFGGLALANAGLGAVHGFAGPIGGLFPAPHGAICAALLANVMEGNLNALRRCQSESEPRTSSPDHESRENGPLSPTLSPSEGERETGASGSTGKMRPSEAIRRYDEVARLLTARASATADEGVAWVRNLVSDLQILRLASYGITREHIPDVVEKAARASSMKANPIVLTPAELAGILERSL